jgi:transcriptional regulator with XRE-family HTH domain
MSPPPSNAILGRAIRRLRRNRRVTIDTLAGDADIHPTYLSGIERGIRNPTVAVLSAIAEALDVPVSRIVLDAEELRDEAERAEAAGLDLDALAALGTAAGLNL